MSFRAIGPLLCAAVLVLAAATSAIAESSQRGRVALDADSNESNVKTENQSKDAPGVRARTDGSRGVWKAPAGIEATPGTKKSRKKGDTSNAKTRTNPGNSEPGMAVARPAEFKTK